MVYGGLYSCDSCALLLYSYGQRGLVIAEPTNGLPHPFPSISWWPCRFVRNMVTRVTLFGYRLGERFQVSVPNLCVEKLDLKGGYSFLWFLTQHVSLSPRCTVSTNKLTTISFVNCFPGDIVPSEEPPPCSDETRGDLGTSTPLLTSIELHERCQCYRRPIGSRHNLREGRGRFGWHAESRFLQFYWPKWSLYHWLMVINGCNPSENYDLINQTSQILWKITNV